MDIDALKALLSYDESTGHFSWKVKRNGGKGIMPGDKAGYLQDKGHKKRYWRIQVCGKYIYAHRLAFAFMTDSWPEEEVDHIDGNGLNNRWSNLRSSSRLDNMRNQKLHDSNKTGISGVHWSNYFGRYEAVVHYHGRKKRLGLFHNFFEACCVRKSWENRMGYDINHGKVRPH